MLILALPHNRNVMRRRRPTAHDHSLLWSEDAAGEALPPIKYVCLLTTYRKRPKGLSQNGGTKEAGFYDGDDRGLRLVRNKKSEEERSPEGLEDFMCRESLTRRHCSNSTTSFGALC